MGDEEFTIKRMQLDAVRETNVPDRKQYESEGFNPKSTRFGLPLFAISIAPLDAAVGTRTTPHSFGSDDCIIGNATVEPRGSGSSQPLLGYERDIPRIGLSHRDLGH